MSGFDKNATPKCDELSRGYPVPWQEIARKFERESRLSEAKWELAFSLIKNSRDFHSDNRALMRFSDQLNELEK